MAVERIHRAFRRAIRIAERSRLGGYRDSCGGNGASRTRQHLASRKIRHDFLFILAIKRIPITEYLPFFGLSKIKHPVTQVKYNSTDNLNELST
ncbi:hypothetical protein [Burkholderia sp. BCC1644]|uniref:hypothetical protein n=1 Tax=Burkholderia sp. BCC1644 TaxID=2676293 RepID=UPI001FC7EDC5|nr:hypothetical protein [Burkholderia sp. BCC1644]